MWTKVTLRVDGSGHGIGTCSNRPVKQNFQWIYVFCHLPSYESKLPDFEKYFIGHSLIKSEQFLPTWILLWSLLLLFQNWRTTYMPKSLSAFFFPAILCLIKEITPPVNLLLISSFVDLLMAIARVDHSTAIKPTGN